MKKFQIIFISFLSIFTTFGFSLATNNSITEDFTYKLSQSNSQYEIWTTTPSKRVFQDDKIPSKIGSELKVYAAQNEFEPIQLVIKPKESGKINIQIENFENNINSELYQVKYVYINQKTDNLGKTGYYPDPLRPIDNTSEINLIKDQNTAIWINIYVPKSAKHGDYDTIIKIGNIAIPIKLHIFDFAIPDELHIKSQMNFSHKTVLDKYGVIGVKDDYWIYVNKIKQYFYDHRLTPKSALWSSNITGRGAQPYIDYDCNGTITDNDGIRGFDIPADNYLNGKLLNNKTGFPSFMAATFVNNDSSKDQRPSEFCGNKLTANDWVGGNINSVYNKKWFEYIQGLQNYLDKKGYLNKAYYYVGNEPQDQADYDAMAWYSKELKKAAPNLKLMVSEEPKTEIYNNPKYPGAKFDIRLPVLNNYNPKISHEREKNYGEETWIYFLHGTRPPYFNPITLDHPGIESKFTGWFLWKYRIKGIAYYSFNNWSKNPWTDPMTDKHNGDRFMLYPPSESNQAISYGSNNHRFVPSIRFELMRDSLEDYEYLYLLNNSQQPEVDITNISDNQADKIISGLTSYTRDDNFMYNLRKFIGLKIGNEINNIPEFESLDKHERAQNQGKNYYINFQDPNSEPGDNPLTINNKNYTKIGWNAYDAEKGYGWYGDLAHVKYQYISNGPNKLQNSIIYDDRGRQKTFEFDLANGSYNVTVGIGWANRNYSHNLIKIEGIEFINDEETNPSNPYIVRSKQIQINDNKLTLEMGIFDEYTMLNFLEIESIAGDISTTVNDIQKSSNLAIKTTLSTSKQKQYQTIIDEFFVKFKNKFSKLTEEEYKSKLNKIDKKITNIVNLNISAEIKFTLQYLQYLIQNIGG